MRGVIFYTLPENLSIWGDPSAWTATLDKMGFDYYVMIDPQNIISNWEETKTITGARVDTMDEALNLIDQPTKVYLTQNGTTELKDFQEPDNVLYILGPDNGDNPNISCDITLKLPAQNLWAIECISAIWGRFL